MKKLYIALAVFVSFVHTSCYKDKSNTSETILPDVEISGINASYNVYTYRDILKISPAVSHEEQYNFYWILFRSSLNVVGAQAPKGDTLSKSRELNYEVLVSPGQYVLSFYAYNKQTTITKIVTTSISVSTLNMNGWYLLKDDGSKTDFDYIYNEGRIDNWMANYNEGKSMTGKSVKAVFAPSFKLTPTSQDLFNAFAVISDNDAGIYRIDNGKKVMGFDEMFFTPPAVKKPQNIFQPVASNILHLINDGDPYFMTKGALFSVGAVTNFKLSPVGSVAAMTLGFDDISKTVVCMDGSNVTAIPASATSLKSMNASLTWMAGYAGTRSIVMAFFKKADGQGRLIKINGAYGFLAGYSTPIVMDSAIIPASHGLMKASVFAGNHDADYIYYASGNKVFVTSVPTAAESLQLSLPEGETVTCMQHIKYPAPATGVTSYKVDYLAIASYNNGRYKVWLHPISSTGTIQPLAQPNFEGQGKVSCINYLEQGLGSRVF